MHINNNLSALYAQRRYGEKQLVMEQSLQRLSSGLRISKAGDDAAGLAISEKMRTQVSGLNQATRNIQDGISMLQVADGGLNEVHTLLQRGRTLAVQAANDTATTSDKQKIQEEINAITKEIDRIASTTEFNTIKILNQEGSGKFAASTHQGIVDGLKNRWLKAAEDLVSSRYGLQGDGAAMEVVLHDENMPYVAAVAGQTFVTGDGRMMNQTLHINNNYFVPPDGNGGVAPQYADRTIAHEMVHAIMGREMNYRDIAKWFREGTAEFIQGADERLAIDSNNKANAANIINEFSNGFTQTSIDYSAAYVATRYMHQAIKDAGGTGIRDVMVALDGLADDAANPLDQALAQIKASYATLAFGSEAQFKANFAANGLAFLNSAAINLANADTGAIGGADADGGSVLTAESVVSEAAGGLANFNVTYPLVASTSSAVKKIQVGANEGQSIDIGLTKADSGSLGIAGVDIVSDAMSAISTFDTAINLVSEKRGNFGALQNRLEHALRSASNAAENTTASESRIRDADMAKEMTAFSKAQILSQASTAMLAQANQKPQMILRLLQAG